MIPSFNHLVRMCKIKIYILLYRCVLNDEICVVASGTHICISTQQHFQVCLQYLLYNYMQVQKALLGTALFFVIIVMAIIVSTTTTVTIFTRFYSLKNCFSEEIKRIFLQIKPFINLQLKYFLNEKFIFETQNSLICKTYREYVKGRGNKVNQLAFHIHMFTMSVYIKISSHINRMMNFETHFTNNLLLYHTVYVCLLVITWSNKTFYFISRTITFGISCQRLHSLDMLTYWAKLLHQKN